MENCGYMERRTTKKVETLKAKSFKAIQNVMALLEQEEKESDTQFYNLAKLIIASVKDEIVLNHAQCETKSLDIIWKRKCQDFLKDIKVFSLCATLESKFKISITPLEPDILQTIQCKQAVYDSIDPKLIKTNDSIVKSVEVSNVIKIDNQILSQQFQDAASVLDESKVKIKGMFCCISKESVYSFASYGIDYKLLENGNIFQTPWFLRNENYSSPSSSSSSSSKYNTQQYEITAKTPSAKELASKNAVDLRYLRFSKHSVNSSLFATTSRKNSNSNSSNSNNNDDINNNSNNTRNSTQANNNHDSNSINMAISKNPLLYEATIEGGGGGGVCLVLCRILLHRVCTVPGVIEEKDMIKAQLKGYDAIYSQSLEEYALLNGSYVLPEFIMHTSINCHTYTEQLESCRNQLISRISGLVDGLLPSELKSFLQLYDDKKVVLPNYDDYSSNSGYRCVNSDKNRYIHFQQSLEAYFRNQNDNNGNDQMNEGTYMDDYTYNSNNSNNANSTNAINNKSSITMKKKRKSMSGTKKSINTHNTVLTPVILADSVNLKAKVDEKIRLELEWRRQQRVEMMQSIEQVTHDFTMNRSQIIKDILTITTNNTSSVANHYI